MGLDTLELLIAVEDRFGITIPDDEAGRTETVGELYQLVLLLIASSSGNRCKTQHVFYRLRSVLPCHLRKRVRPASQLSEIIPQANIRQVYARLETDVGLALPPLVAPRWFFYFSNTVILLTITLTVLFFEENLVFVAELVLLISLLIRLLNAFSEKLSTRHRGTTVRDLVVSTTAGNYQRVLPDHHNEREVLAVLKTTIVDATGVKPAEVTLSAKFAEDLKIQ